LSILNAFTVDVEDYYHVNAFSDRIDPRQWDAYESRVVANTHRVLRLLERHQVRATFFVLGWVADRHPVLVKDIQRSGHEIGCHSFWHRLIYTMTPDEFRDDLRQARRTIEDVIGQPVTAFRAPCFSVTARSLWALDILVEEGFRYDSSIFPVHHDNYGIPGAERFPYAIEGRQGTLHEFPPSVYPLWNYNLPVAGGGYFRLYPLRLSLHWLGRINRVDRQPFMFYIHPWEVDPDQPRLAGSLRSRFRHYQNLRSTEPKLDRLLQTFAFGTLTDVLAANSSIPTSTAIETIRLAS
jgi:polysaccharide deacetylase family protein (PEP-CTERM system associated)